MTLRLCFTVWVIQNLYPQLSSVIEQLCVPARALLSLSGLNDNRRRGLVVCMGSHASLIHFSFRAQALRMMKKLVIKSQS